MIHNMVLNTIIYSFCISDGIMSSFLFEIQEKEAWDLNNAEKLEAAGKKKEEGNVLFKSGNYVRASKRYEKVLYFIKPYIVVQYRAEIWRANQSFPFFSLLVLLGSKVHRV